MAALSSTKYTNMKENKKQSFNKIKTSKFQAEQDKSIDGLKEIFLIFEQAIKDDKNAAAFVGAILASTPSNQGHFMRTSAPIRFFTTNLQAGPKGIRFVEEHSLPASLTAKYLLNSAIQNNVTPTVTVLVVASKICKIYGSRFIWFLPIFIPVEAGIGMSEATRIFSLRSL